METPMRQRRRASRQPVLLGAAAVVGVMVMTGLLLFRTGDGHQLATAEPVAMVELGREAKAYPLQILVWHEIVNDQVGGVPVAVTYCPLCNTAISFRRPVVNGAAISFGTSGKLYRSNLVMYDRATRSLWPQALGQAVTGLLPVPSPRLAGRARRGVTAANLELAGGPVLVVWRSGATSALDRRSIAASREVGAAAAFSRQVG